MLSVLKPDARATLNIGVLPLPIIIEGIGNRTAVSVLRENNSRLNTGKSSPRQLDRFIQDNTPLEFRRILKRIFKPPVALKVLIYERNDYYTLYVKYNAHHVRCTPNIAIDYLQAQDLLIIATNFVFFKTINNQNV